MKKRITCLFLIVTIHLSLSVLVFGQNDREYYWKPVYKFSGGTSTNTDEFTIKGEEWRIEWKITKQNSELSDGHVKAYLVSSFGHKELITDYTPDDMWHRIMIMGGTYYFNITSSNSNWEFEVQVKTPRPLHIRTN